MIRILLAEDHQIVRNGIKKVLENAGTFEVIAETSNGKEALQLIEQGASPDIVLTDMNMPEMNGIELVENIKQTSQRHIKTVMLTMFDNENYVVDAFNSGVDGYLLKNISTEELMFALSHIHRNNRYICSDLAMRMFSLANHKNNVTDCMVDFSKRETEVLSLIARGYTNKEIADKLYTSRRTVEGHRQTMINKANVRNSAELIRFAVKNSLID